MDLCFYLIKEFIASNTGVLGLNGFGNVRLVAAIRAK